jgi:ABC-2 type transport system permease protein
MKVLTRKLIAKELHQHGWIVSTVTLVGLGALAVAPLGKMQFNIGLLVWLSTVIALGVILVLTGITNERKERSLLYVLSLPLSAGDYVRIKLAGLVVCFGLAWLALSAAAVALVVLEADVPDGMLPYGILLCVYLFANFAVVLCAGLHIRAEGPMTAVVVATNMGVTVFMFTVGATPALHDHMFGSTPVWNSAFWMTLAIELAVTAAALILPLLVAARRRDHL